MSVTKVMDDKAIVLRSNGERHLIEKGTGCLSLWRYEGKRVYINSPGLFLGVGSSLLLPDSDQECRIWNSELLDSGGTRLAPPAATPTPEGWMASPSTLQRGLNLIGYTVPGTGALDQETTAAFGQYLRLKGYGSNEHGIKMGLMAMSADIMKKHPSSEAAFTVARQLFESARRGSATKAGGGCTDGIWVSSVAGSGAIVKLSDGSVWEIDAVDTIDTMLWLPTEDVLVCGTTLVNTENGDKVTGTKLK